MLDAKVNRKLIELRQSLQEAALWASSPPSLEAMASTTPFCCDTMPLEHWLQFIFIPRMQALIDGKLPLPTAVAIAPMAQHVWAQQADKQSLIAILNQLDILLNAPR